MPWTQQPKQDRPPRQRPMRPSRIDPPQPKRPPKPPEIEGYAWRWRKKPPLAFYSGKSSSPSVTPLQASISTAGYRREGLLEAFWLLVGRFQ